MALGYSVNLIDGDLDVSYQTDGRVIAKGTRTAFVTGLTDGSSDQSATALQRAMDLITADYPRGSFYSGRWQGCIVVRHQAIGVRTSDDACMVKIFYDTPPTQSGSASPWTVEDSTEEVSDKTQIDPKTWEPLRCTFTDPNNHANDMGDILTIEYPSEVRSIVLSGYKLAIDLPKFRAAVRTVNSDTFLGLAPGYWKMSRFVDSFPIGQGVDIPVYYIAIELKTRIVRNWASFGILRDTNTRRYVQIRANTMKGLKDAPYSYGIIKKINGAILLGPYDLTGFGALFGPLAIS